MQEYIHKYKQRVFAVDALGALLTATTVGLVLPWIQQSAVSDVTPVATGMPIQVFYRLGILGSIFALYSFLCDAYRHKLHAKHRFVPCLYGIMLANTLYCLISAYLIFHFYARLPWWEVAYFVGEIAIVSGVVAGEGWVAGHIQDMQKV